MIHRRECWLRRFLNLVRRRECPDVPVRRVLNDPPSGPQGHSPWMGIVDLRSEGRTRGDSTIQRDAESREEGRSESVETT